MSKPTIKTVAVTKRGRFWAVHTDGELLALVLYERGAMAVRDLLVRLTGITVNEPPKAGELRAAHTVEGSSSQSPATVEQARVARAAAESARNASARLMSY